MRVSAPLRINGSFSAAERKSPSAECGMRAPPFDCQQRTAQGHAATMTYLFISVNKSTRTTNIPTGTGSQFPHNFIQDRERTDLLDDSLGA